MNNVLKSMLARVALIIDFLVMLNNYKYILVLGIIELAEIKLGNIYGISKQSNISR